MTSRRPLICQSSSPPPILILPPTLRSRHGCTPNNREFSDRQTTNSELETAAEVAGGKNVFLLRRTCSAAESPINSQSASFGPDQLAVTSGGGMSSDCAAGGGLFDYAYAKMILCQLSLLGGGTGREEGYLYTTLLRASS